MPDSNDSCLKKRIFSTSHLVCHYNFIEIFFTYIIPSPLMHVDIFVSFIAVQSLIGLKINVGKAIF